MSGKYRTYSLGVSVLLLFLHGLADRLQAAERPNVVLMMADDLGWGDVGFNGGEMIKTPHLDAMAAAGLTFTRFYAAAPVCSPTRGSCLTGRHPFRYGIHGANHGHLPNAELTLAELLKEAGYTTGHFGKWHLGTLAKDFSGKGPQRQPGKNFSPPDASGFDEWFSTEFAVATWDPYDPRNSHVSKRFPYDTRALYWHNGQNVTQPLEGDDSRIIMDRVLPFVHQAVSRKQPFFAVVWFHAPHAPVIGGPGYRAMYAEHPEDHQHYYACVTALDEQVGRLRRELRRLGVADNTMVWFCSDNGPAGKGGGTKQSSGGRQQGSAGPFRGRKGSLYEGGVRVPGLLEWPAGIKAGSVTDLPAVTSDYLPTIASFVGAKLPNARPLDGVDLLPLIESNTDIRPSPIGFQSGRMVSLNDNRFKLISADNRNSWQLYDLVDDEAETTDLAKRRPDVVKQMVAVATEWQASCRRSEAGSDTSQ